MTKIFVENNACIPTVANKGDAGIDLRYSGTKAFEIKKGIVYKIPTSTYVEIPEGKCGIIMERSGLGLKGINIMGRIIDAPYRGQICVILDKNSDTIFDLSADASNYPLDIQPVLIKPGDKIAQMVIVDIHPEFELVNNRSELSDTTRGEKGFGSSDKK
jgi:deoxyuridine 5'-triphosphate nucleotidohydrolase